MPDRKVGKIEARPTRVARSQWSRDPERVKGEAAEVETGPVPFLLVRQRTSAGLSQKFFVKRYQWLFGTARPGAAVPHIP